MPARLIINADDFGLTPGINRAILELHGAGVVTSTTLMATGPAFEDAVTRAIATQGLGVGCHIVLVDGAPVSSAATIPSLLGEDGCRFRPTLGSFVRDLLLGRINREEMELEASAQMDRLRQRGLSITHLDTHKHTHIFPQVGGVLARLARSAYLPIRNPFEPCFSRQVSPAGIVRRAQLGVLRRLRPSFDRLSPDTPTTDGTLGVAATGRMNADTLRRILDALPDHGTYELCCHPGYNDSDLERITTRLRAQRDIERVALLAVVPQIFSLPNAPQLIHYGDLGKHP